MKKNLFCTVVLLSAMSAGAYASVTFSNFVTGPDINAVETQTLTIGFRFLVTPEPSSLILFGTMILGVGYTLRRHAVK